MPTGVWLENFCTSVALMPFQMCDGMIGIARPGSKACGVLNVTTTVEGSVALTSVISSSHWAYWEFPCEWTS